MRLSNDEVGHEDSTTDTSSGIYSRVDSRKLSTNVGFWSPTSSELDSIRNTIKQPSRPFRASLPVYMKGSTAEALKRIAKEQGTSFSRFVETICDSYLNTQQLKSPQQAKPDATEVSQPENVLSGEDRLFLDQVKSEWSARDQQWRDRQSRYIISHYGPVGESFLQDVESSTTQSSLNR